MKAREPTKTALALKMHASRAAVNRLLDAEDATLTLDTPTGAAAALGKKIKFELVAA
ncbi:hypothetical protein [Polaromonas sp.]|uniref:hypothetical protein n=1 Tax=Polaromonas sp. TaxID=1869339 RepID=UPI0039C9F734